MIISIASGKGGTGKTTIAINLALSLKKNIQYIDCDVEEPNGAIFLKPDLRQKDDVNVPVPEIDSSKCTGCGNCAKTCQFHALAVIKDKVLLFQCESGENSEKIKIWYCFFQCESSENGKLCKL